MVLTSVLFVTELTAASPTVTLMGYPLVFLREEKHVMILKNTVDHLF